MIPNLAIVAGVTLAIACGCRLHPATSETVPISVRVALAMLGGLGIVCPGLILMGASADITSGMLMLAIVYLLVADRRRGGSFVDRISALRARFDQLLKSRGDLPQR